MRALVVLCALGLLAGAAEAHRARMWGADLEPFVSYATQGVESPEGGRTSQIAVGAGARAFFGLPAVQLAASLDLDLGLEVPAGFVYGLHLLPVGIGLPFGERGALGVAAGGGFSGASPRLPFAGELDVEAFFGLDLGTWLRVHGSARGAWTSADQRDGGAPDAAWLDELDLRLGVAVGRREHDWGMSYSDGTCVSVELREQAGERMLGILLSLAVSMAQ